MDTSPSHYFNSTTSGTFGIKPVGQGVLHTVTFNTPAASGTVKFYDGAVGGGIVIGTVALPVAAGGPVTLIYDAPFTNGLTMVVVGASDITVTFN